MNTSWLHNHMLVFVQHLAINTVMSINRYLSIYINNLLLIFTPFTFCFYLLFHIHFCFCICFYTGLSPPPTVLSATTYSRFLIHSIHPLIYYSSTHLFIHSFIHTYILNNDIIIFAHTVYMYTCYYHQHWDNFFTDHTLPPLTLAPPPSICLWSYLDYSEIHSSTWHIWLVPYLLPFSSMLEMGKVTDMP